MVEGIKCVKLGGRRVKNNDRISILGDLEDGGSINQEVKINMTRSFSKRIFHFSETAFSTIMQLMCS